VVDRGDGGPVIAASLSAGFARIADGVGLGDVRLHDLRHGFAVALLRAGVNVKVVSEALGHSRASFTLDPYMHVLPGWGSRSDRPSRRRLPQFCRHSAVRVAAGNGLMVRAHHC
jgi:integrase